MKNLEETLFYHKKWLNRKKGGVKANLSETDLRGTDLSGTDLRGANLRGANLRGANLSETDLSETNLSGTDLRGANLSGAKGVFSMSKWFSSNFEKSKNNDGYIVYKAINSTVYSRMWLRCEFWYA